MSETNKTGELSDTELDTVAGAGHKKPKDKAPDPIIYGPAQHPELPDWLKDKYGNHD